MILLPGQSIHVKGGAAATVEEFHDWFRHYAVRRKSKIVISKTVPMRKIREKDGVVIIAIGESGRNGA